MEGLYTQNSPFHAKIASPKEPISGNAYGSAIIPNCMPENERLNGNVCEWNNWGRFSELLNNSIVELNIKKPYLTLLDMFHAYGTKVRGFMSDTEFYAFLEEYDAVESAYRSVLFNLMDRNSDGFITQNEFLSGMVAFSPNTPHNHDNFVGRLRLQFIFLYYDFDRNGLLSNEELSKLIEHIMVVKSLENKKYKDYNLKAKLLASKVIEYCGGMLSFDLFYKCVSNGILNGTQVLLRMRSCILEMVERNKNAVKEVNYAKCSHVSNTVLGEQQMGYAAVPYQNVIGNSSYDGRECSFNYNKINSSYLAS